MNLNNNQLNELIAKVARDIFGLSIFKRRRLMLAVETRVKEEGAWTPDDDAISTSRGRKTEGLAKIDWAISHLKEKGHLLNVSRDKWRLP